MDLNDFYQQIIQMKRMGSMRDLMAKIPDLRQDLVPSDVDVDREVDRIRGVMESMTPLKRTYPFLTTVPSRRQRIAKGAGVELSAVSNLYTQFMAMQKLVAGMKRVV